jgi:UDP-N-acetylmuramyl pentapeptide phosphotransferase/UDP-N-acetylglucosamine-1-phosphate transferase
MVVTWLLAVLASLVVTAWVVRMGHAQPGRMADSDFSGPQKFHERPVPRVGGLGIAAGLWAAAGSLWMVDPSQLGLPALLLLACGLPAFLAGLTEDLTKQVSPAQRLVFTGLSAVLALFVLGNGITRTDLPGLDWLVAFAPFAAVLTVFAVVGVANSINLIDGFNGLASTCVAIMLLGLAAVAWRVGDPLVLSLALAGVGAVLGFLVWNFPRGLVFLGDGGAYFLGFYLAELALLLLARNPAVSPLFPLLLVVYPVFETVFSMYRRKVLKGRPIGQPDGAHLHSLIFRRFLRSDFAKLDADERTRRNSMTSPYLWLLSLMSVGPAVWFWDSSAWLLAGVVLFGCSYLALYWRIVRFRGPRWMMLRSQAR